jgi:hypothetical protein
MQFRSIAQCFAATGCLLAASCSSGQAAPDAQGPDAQGPDAQAPDAQAPDAQAPDAQAPDAQGLDAQAPDAQGLDAQAPDAGSVVTPRDCGTSLLVPVRVHLLRSTQERLNATWTPDEARVQLGAAAEFWSRHCIALAVESVVTTPATSEGEAAFATAIAAAPVERLRLRAALSAAIPRAALLSPGWNVFVIRDFGAPALGVFVPDPGVQSIFIGQQRLDGVPLPRFVLAHEFGHSFTLLHHVGPDRERNLMRDDPQALVEPVEITPEQLRSARAQAATGSPRGS